MGIFLLSCLSAPSHAEKNFNKSDIESFVYGATIMAAGGGGSPSIAFKLLSQYLKDSDNVDLYDVSDIETGKGYR